MARKDRIEFPTNTPFFEKDKDTNPPLIPCNPWLIPWLAVLEEVNNLIDNPTSNYVIYEDPDFWSLK